MALNYEALRELVRKSLEECGGMVHPSTPSPITIIPSKKPDQEGKMAKRQVFGVIVDATEIETMLTDDQELDGWIQSKLTKAADYISAVKKYLEYDLAHNPVSMGPPDEIPLPPLQENLSSDDWRTLEKLLKDALSAARSAQEKEVYQAAFEQVGAVTKWLQEASPSDNAKEQSKGKKGDVRDVAKLMFKDQRLGPALAKLKDDKREAAQLISIIGGQLGLTPEDLVQIAKMASRESK